MTEYDRAIEDILQQGKREGVLYNTKHTQRSLPGNLVVVASAFAFGHMVNKCALR